MSIGKPYDSSKDIETQHIAAQLPQPHIEAPPTERHGPMYWIWVAADALAAGPVMGAALIYCVALAALLLDRDELGLALVGSVVVVSVMTFAVCLIAAHLVRTHMILRSLILLAGAAAFPTLAFISVVLL